MPEVRRFEVPLPPEADCRDCVELLHRDLLAVPSVAMATLDAARHVAVIETTGEESQVRPLVASALARVAGHSLHRRPVLPMAAPPASPEGPGHGRGDHDHEPGDGHGHDPGLGGHRESALKNRKRLLLVAAAGFVVMLAELIGGWASNSLVLIADAGHYATDIASVILALVAVHWSLKPATARKTFGHHRSEVVAAFVQAIALWAISAVFLYEAYLRIRDPPDVHGPIVFAIGGLTLVTNLVLARVLHAGSGHNINMRAAYLHILSDVLGSAAALVAGALVFYKGWDIADPLLTIFITVLILAFTVRLTRQSLHILLEGTPHDVHAHEVEKALLAVPGVKEVHDLHIWSHTSGMNSLTAHVVLHQAPTDDRATHAIHDVVRRDFRINHVTIQLENPACPCDTLKHDWTA